MRSVRVKAGGDFLGEPAVSDEIRYEVEVSGGAPGDRLRALVARVDENRPRNLVKRLRSGARNACQVVDFRLIKGMTGHKGARCVRSRKAPL